MILLSWRSRLAQVPVPSQEFAESAPAGRRARHLVATAGVAGRTAGGLLLVACAATTPAWGALEVTATATVAAETTLVVDVRNPGDHPVSDVAPVVVYQGQERHGDARPELAAGARTAWTVTLPPPAEPGTVPAVIDVHYRDGAQRRSVPAVAAVSTPGLLSEPEVRAAFTTGPVTSYARAELLLDNPTPSSVHGRVIVVLPAGLSTEPTSQAAEVPANGRRAVPLVIQNDGAAPDAGLPALALFEYDSPGRRHLAIAPVTVPVVGGGPSAPPLLVGSVALALALALCGVAWRRAAAKRHRNG